MKYDLERFIKAQGYDYDQALSEMKNGRKQSHWIWYIFPQLKGLGFSSMSDFYGIDGMGEAKAYMEHPVLRERLLEITHVLLTIKSSDPSRVMGYLDDLKLKSSMTLFAEVAPEQEVFLQVLDKFFDGKKDQKTLQLLNKKDH